jgi:hypothetical protein
MAAKRDFIGDLKGYVKRSTITARSEPALLKSWAESSDKRFVVLAGERLTAFVELESALLGNHSLEERQSRIGRGCRIREQADAASTKRQHRY